MHASDSTFARLTDQLGRIEDLRAAADVLEWDQETYMPAGAADVRVHQVATLRTLAHELFTADETGELLERLHQETAGADPLSTEASLARVARRDYDKARKLPASLVNAFAQAVARAKTAWREARQANDFGAFAPHLEALVDLNREKADAYGYEDQPYDALLDQYEPGMTTAEVAEVFDDLREQLVPIVHAISEQPPPDDAVLRKTYPAQQQWDFGVEVLRDFGYDFNRGRQDRSAHPFTTSFSIYDVRLTTRVNERFLPSALFGTLHECGHGLYEQGIDPSLDRTPLADGTSLGIHESQSRLWENLVGRSRAFWTHYYPALVERFPSQLGDVPLGAFYRAVNRVAPSLIRVEADEVTYNLHIMLRFELEQAMLNGDLAIGDLPGAWNERLDDYLGLRPLDDAHGVLQDIHWSLGTLGYFPTYALGNLMSVQFFEAAQADLGDLSAHFAAGRFEPLHTWLREHIYHYGRKLQAPELLERVTGQELSAEPWLQYVRTKYGSLYEGV